MRAGKTSNLRVAALRGPTEDVLSTLSISSKDS